MSKHRAIAENGPLEGVLNLTVEADDEDWPPTVQWEGPERGQRQLYRWLTVSNGPNGDVPVYEFVRALNPPQSLFGSGRRTAIGGSPGRAGGSDPRVRERRREAG